MCSNMLRTIVPNGIKFSWKRVAYYLTATLVSLKMTTTKRDGRGASRRSLCACAENVIVFFQTQLTM